MTSPIEIPDLSPASSINPNSDFVIVRQGASDRKATVAQIANINFASYVISGTPIVASDVFVIGQNDGLGNYNNVLVTPQRIGFLIGTVSWFYQPIAPLGWSIVPGTGDKILGVTDTTGNFYNGASAGTLSGNWQQTGVSLGVTQIPNHQHFMRGGSTSDNNNNNFMEGARYPTGVNPAYSVQACLGVVNGAGDIPTHDAFGACDPHNHGNSWRPSAVVGIVCVKVE